MWDFFYIAGGFFLSVEYYSFTYSNEVEEWYKKKEFPKWFGIAQLFYIVWCFMGLLSPQFILFILMFVLIFLKENNIINIKTDAILSIFIISLMIILHLYNLYLCYP